MKEEKDLLRRLEDSLINKLSDSNIESNFIREKINEIKQYRLSEVRSSIANLINELEYHLTIGVEGEQDHGLIEIVDALLGMDNRFVDEVAEIGKQSNNNILRLSFIEGKSYIETRRVGRESNSPLALEDKSVSITKPTNFISSAINKTFNRKVEYDITMPVLHNNALHQKMKDNNVDIIVFPGKKETENDNYQGKLDLIIAVVDNRKTTYKDKIISDALEENHVMVYPVIIKSYINDDTRAVFENIPSLRGYSDIVEIAADDQSQMNKLRQKVERFIDKNRWQSFRNINWQSISKIDESSLQNRKLKIKKAGETFAKAMNSFMIEIDNLRADVVLDTYYTFNKWDKNTVKNNKKIRKAAESYYKAVLKDLNSRLKKASDVVQLKKIVADLTSDEYLFSKNFDLVTKIQGDFDNLKDERKRVLLKEASKLRIKKQNLSMNGIIEGIFKDFRLKIDTNILRTKVLSEEVERYRDEICSPLLSGSMFNPKWAQMRAKKKIVRNCIKFLQIEAIIDNVSAVIVRNIEQIKKKIDDKIIEYTEHDNDVKRVVGLQKEIYDTLESLSTSWDSPSFRIIFSLPSNSTKQLEQSGLDCLQSNYTQDREIISIQSTAESF